MHIVNLYKHAKLGGLVMAGAFASSIATAEVYTIGGYEINVDTTVSTGATFLMSDRRDAYLPEANGGNPNANPSFNIAQSALPILWKPSKFKRNGDLPVWLLWLTLCDGMRRTHAHTKSNR